MAFKMISKLQKTFTVCVGFVIILTLIVSTFNSVPINKLFSMMRPENNGSDIIDRDEDFLELKLFPVEQNGIPLSYVLAAFFDHRVNKIVIFASSTFGDWLKNQNEQFHYKCILLYRDKNEPVEVDGEFITEYMIHCPILNDSSIPYSISVQSINESRNKDHIDWTIPVVNLLERKRIYSPKKLAVCSVSLFGKQSWLMLLQYIEFHRKQGVEKMVFFYRDIEWSTKKIFQWYKIKYPSFIETIRWTPFDHFPSEGYLFNQQLRNNYCIYSLMYKYKFVGSNDFDELFFTNESKSLYDHLEIMDSSTMGSFTFRAKYHLLLKHDLPPLSDKLKDNVSDIVSNFLPLYHFNYVSDFVPHRFSPKVIMKPESVLIFTVHCVQTFVADFENYFIPEDIGFLRHFKIREWWGDRWVKQVEEMVNFNHVNPWSEIGKELLLHLLQDIINVTNELYMNAI